MPCSINDIVTLGACPDDGTPKSGFTLLKAPGISIKNLSNIASDTYIQGSALAMEKKELTLIQFKNDFIGALQANRVITSITEPVYNTSYFNPNLNMGTYAGERGIVIHKAGGYKGTLRSTKLKAIEVYPLEDGDGDIVIYDGYNEYSYPVTFVANQLNTFGEDELDGFPFTINDNPNVTAVKILIDNTDIAFASAEITCMKGCNGSMPNPCGWANGWDGTKYVKEEGYGINVQFYCHCDYEKIICDLSSSFTGELIWLKWQMNIYDEQYKTNRFNNWVIYNRDDIHKNILPDLERQYTNKWNAMMAGLYDILKTYRDDCLNCRGIKRVTNI